MPTRVLARHVAGLSEECGELAAATGGEIVGELADVLEVLRALAADSG